MPTDGIAGELELRRLELEELERERVYRARAHRDVTTRRLALLLVTIMGITISVHYVTIAVLVTRGEDAAAAALGQVLDVWLPVISGLVGAAIAFYFARDK